MQTKRLIGIPVLVGGLMLGLAPQAAAQPRQHRPPPLDNWEIPAARVPAGAPAPAARVVRVPLAAMGGSIPPLVEFPYRANDFADDEAVFVGKPIHNPEKPNQVWQQFAYDIGVARRLSDGRWTDVRAGFSWANPTNAGYLIYDRPVYAVSEGVIVNCWRNAPENPRPYSPEVDRPQDTLLHQIAYLHPEMRAGRMYGAGNFITVLEANGNRVGYAHARSGSIPASLCPHNGALLHPDGWETASAVPAAQQVRVRPGDLLFRTGNTGSSSAPHLHIDRTAPDSFTSIQLRFRHGRASRLDTNGRRVSNQWISFSGEQIPPGPVLVRPPYRGGGEYAWYGLTESAYVEKFAHMHDSGYQVVWIDGYSVSGTPHYNVIWRPATAPWRSYHRLTGTEYQARYTEAAQAGYALVHVDSYVQGGQPRYAAVFVEGASTDLIARHDLNGVEFQAWFDDVSSRGYSPVSTSVISINGNRRYTAIFRRQDLGSWVLKTSIPAAEYQSEYDANAAAGRSPYFVNAFLHAGSIHYTAAFAQRPTGPRKDRHNLNAATLQTEFDSALAAGLSLRSVAGIDGFPVHQFVAVWRR